jgi:hypothetical protein
MRLDVSIQFPVTYTSFAGTPTIIGYPNILKAPYTHTTGSSSLSWNLDVSATQENGQELDLVKHSLNVYVVKILIQQCTVCMGETTNEHTAE